jgi:hypothetical protein
LCYCLETLTLGGEYHGVKSGQLCYCLETLTLGGEYHGVKSGQLCYKTDHGFHWSDHDHYTCPDFLGPI